MVVNGVDLERDTFDITYDPARVTPERLLETVGRQGFRGRIVAGSPRERSAVPAGRRDLARLPEEFQGSVREARERGRPLLLSFRAPG